MAEDFNMDAALQSMSDTFGGPASSEAPSAADPSPPPAETAPSPAAVPATPSPWDTPPKAWKGDMHPHWTSLNPDVRKYLYEREDQAFKGITEARKAYDPYDAVNKKFAKAFEQHKVQNPAEVYDRMLNAHLHLKFSPDETRKAIFQNLLKDYGLEDIARGLFGGGAAPGGQPQPQHPAIDPLRLVHEAIEPIRTEFQTFAERFQAREQADAQKMIEAFLGAKENEFAEELLPDMTELFRNGFQGTLADAYERTKWQNPAVRAKLIAREVEAAAKPPKPAPKSVTSSATPPRPSAKSNGSIDDTMKEVMESIQNRS